MEQLGSYLKAQREIRQIDIRDIATETKIGVTWLKVIEEDRWDDLPGKTFARGYAKAYAKALGLDVHEALTRYDNMYAGIEKVEVGSEVVALTKKRGYHRFKRFIPFIVIAAIVAVVLILWLV